MQHLDLWRCEVLSPAKAECGLPAEGLVDSAEEAEESEVGLDTGDGGALHLPAA